MLESSPNPSAAAQDEILLPHDLDLLKDMDIVEATPEKTFLGNLNGLLRGTIENLDALERSLNDSHMIGLLREKISGREDGFNTILSEAHTKISLRLQDSHARNDPSATVLCEQAIVIINKVTLLTTRGLTKITPTDDILTPFGGPSAQNTDEALSNANSQISLEADRVETYKSLSQEKKLLADKLKNFLNDDNMSLEDLQALCKDIVMDRDGDEVKDYLQKQLSFKDSITRLVARNASAKESVKSETGKDTLIAFKNRVDAEEKLIDYLYGVKTTDDDFEEKVVSFDVTKSVGENLVPSLPDSRVQKTIEQRVENIETALGSLFQGEGVPPDVFGIRIVLTQPYNRGAIELLNTNNEFIAKIVAYLNKLTLLGKENVSVDTQSVLADIKAAFNNSQIQNAIKRFDDNEIIDLSSKAETPQFVNGFVTSQATPALTPSSPTFKVSGWKEEDPNLPRSALPVEKPDERERNNLTLEEAVKILFTSIPVLITKNAQQITVLFSEKEKEIFENIIKNYSSKDIAGTLYLLNLLNEDKDGDGSKVKGIFDDIIDSLEKLLSEMPSINNSKKPQGVGAEASNDSTVSSVTTPTEIEGVSGGAEAGKGANNEILQSVADQRVLEKENAKKSLELLHNLNFSELYKKSALILENLSTFDANVEAGKVTNETEKKIRATRKGILKEMSSLESKGYKEDDDDEKRTKLQAFLNILNQLYPGVQNEASGVSKLGSVLRGFATKTKSRLVTDIQWVKNRAGSMVNTTQIAKERMLAAVQKLKKEVSHNLREGVGVNKSDTLAANMARVELTSSVPIRILDTQGTQAEEPLLVRTPEAQKAEKNVYKFIKSLPEKYEKLEPKTKLILSASLLGLGFAGTALSMAPVVAAVGAAKVVLRGFSAIAAAKGAQKFIEASRLNGNWKKDAKNIGWGVGLAVFALGSVQDLHHFGSWVSEQISFGVPAIGIAQDVGIPPASTASTSGWEKFTGIPTDHNTTAISNSVAGMPSETAPAHDITTNTPPNPTDASLQPENVAKNSHFGNLKVHTVTISQGDTLSKVMLSDVLPAAFPEEFQTLSSLGLQNIMANIADRLTEADIKAIGIMSGKLTTLQIGDTVDVKKLAEFAQKMTVQMSDGSNWPLLKRAQLL